MIHFIDGSNEELSSWMRFIQCARSSDEQNLFAFQYKGNVYYRSFKDIAVGEELLVWYDEKYLQHFGIPTGLQDMSFVINQGGRLNKRDFFLENLKGRYHTRISRSLPKSLSSKVATIYRVRYLISNGNSFCM